MAQYANQRTLIINREQVDFKSNKPYLSAYTENIAAASRALKGEVAFKLYLYFLSNKNNYETDFSPTNFANLYAVSTKAAQQAFTKLEEAGFITRDGANYSKYTFHEVAQTKEEKVSIELPNIERRWIKTQNGSYTPMSYKEVYNILSENYTEDEIKAYWASKEVVTNEL